VAVTIQSNDVEETFFYRYIWNFIAICFHGYDSRISELSGFGDSSWIFIIDFLFFILFFLLYLERG